MILLSTRSCTNLTCPGRAGGSSRAVAAPAAFPPAHPCSARLLSPPPVSSLSWQVDPDDVLTKEEQIYLLVEAKEKCHRDIKAQLEKIKGSVPPLRTGQRVPVELGNTVPSHGSGMGTGTRGSRGSVELLVLWLLWAQLVLIKSSR